ncbi:glycosyltransferase family 2 protein [Microbulbifer sp. OS29]|uniref:Glycosyltransferase family 2 protein n=1 Tax=Microbulbifer okhotskensis TaxID=2926617 RepID=A0A9X2EP90_9GAMM|nr:glycosyltransferase family 2 protein [Microbulbifer okhotskensis]MCO1335321.1 glycosyltransferase family 2 protein [Microbulbifer okhotskensis]
MKAIRLVEQAEQAVFPLICIFRDEIDIFPAFLDHYRSIGVTCFHFVDTGSNDESCNYLLKQNDVQLYSVDGGYPQANAGVDWVNRIAREYCQGKWTLVVDADEFLVLPKTDNKISLTHTTHLLKNELAFALYTPLIDFFSDDLTAPPVAVNNLAELIATTPHYVPYSNFKAKGIRAFPFFEIRSNARSKISGVSNYFVKSYKIPLVYWRPDFQYIRSTHACTPVPLSDRCGHLFHFKFRAGFKQRLEKELKNPDRMNSDVYRISKAIVTNQKSIPVHTSDLRTTGGFQGSDWLSQDTFAGDWKNENHSKAYYFELLNHQKIPSESYLADNLSRLTESFSWRLSRPLRGYLFSKGVLRHDHYPERLQQDHALVDQTIAIYESFWWLITGVVRLPVAIYRAILWHKLKGRRRLK